MRDECLNVHQFPSLAEAQAILDAWRCKYNQRLAHAHSGTNHKKISQSTAGAQIVEEPLSLPKDSLVMGPTSVPGYSRFEPSQIGRSLRTKTIWITTVSAALLLAAIVVWLVNRMPTSECDTEPQADSNVHTLRPIKLVVAPWQGQHHAYGLFVVPERFQYDQLSYSSLTIQGLSVAFSSEHVEVEDDVTVILKPGYYLMRVYVQTRTALWYLATGRFGGLRTPCLWLLKFDDRMN